MEQREAQKAAAQRPSGIVPASNYKDKYEHLIGKEAAKDAAKITLANKAYGFGMCIFTYSIKKSLWSRHTLPSKIIDRIEK